MAKTLMKALHTEMTADLPAVAALLQKKGRGKDTILAHITPKEAALLKQRGGRGSRNPETGLLEFEDDLNLSGAVSYPYESTDIPTATPEPSAVSEPPSQYNIGANIPQAPGMEGAAGIGVQGQLAAPEAPPSAPFATGTAPGLTLPKANVIPDIYGPLAQPSVGGVQAPQPPKVAPSPTPAAPAAPTKGILESLGLSGPQALGGAVLGGLGAIQARNAAQQGQQAKQELLAQAAPYQQQGARQVAAAQAGQLSPASQQAYEAARARAAQAGQAAGGGVGVVQSEAALESLRQQLLAGDLNIGLQIQAIGDKIAQGAISAGVQADQYVNTLTSNYASNVARVLMGTSPQIPGQQTTQTAGT